MSDDRINELEKRVEELEEVVFQGESQDARYSGKKLSVREFLDSYDASSHNDKVLIIGRYLEKVEGQENFTSEDVEDCYRKAKLKPPQTMGVPLSKDAKKGLVMEDGEDEDYKLWVLTRKGEQYVEDLKEDEG
ncbi:MAG: hypothetical protein ABEJ98_06005 [Candidatus Nanohaloarchaea archaeon]